MFGKRFSRALAVTTVASLVMASAAFADDISNNLDVTVDATAEVMNLTAGGDNGTTLLRVITQNGDGKNGCNLTGSTVLTVSVASSDIAVATVSPASVTFTSCGDTPALTVTPVAQGSATISLTQTANTTGGTFNLAPATFTANVGAVSDPCASVSAPAAPVFTFDGDDYDGMAGWFVTIPTVSAASSTAGATITYSIGGTTFSATPPTLGQGTSMVTARATSATCSKTSDTSTTFNVDTVAPTVTPGSVVDSDWRNSSLAQLFGSFDATSGLADYGDASFTLTASAQSADGSTPTVDSHTVYDNAGNSTTRSVSALIDLTDPTVSLVGGPTDGASYYFGSVPAAPTCSASDVLSGLAGPCGVSGYSSAVGTHTVTASATDRAGNSNSASASYTVLAWTIQGFYRPVDMSVLNSAKAGSTIPLKFEVFAGTTELTNIAIVKAFTQKIACDTSGTPDPIEEYASGNTSLRYDATGGQFIFNWKTPSTKGCYRVTLETQDATKISADFQLK